MINRIYGIVLLTVFVLYRLTWLVPYFEYVVNNDYIAKNICVKKDIPNNCCHGKCYLAKQLNKLDEDNNSKPKNTIPKNNNQEDKEYLCFKTITPIIFGKVFDYISLMETSITTKYYPSIFHPPKNNY